MEWLKTIRLDKGISQKSVADQVHITQPSYANIESGKRRPAVETAKAIAGVLDFDWQRFYE